MTPEEHIQAIEDAAKRYAEVRAIERKDGVKLKASSITLKSLESAIRAAVGAAQDSNLPTYTDDLELRYVEACEERDHLRQLLPREGWQLVPVEPTNAMLDALEEGGCSEGNYKAALAAAPKP